MTLHDVAFFIKHKINERHYENCNGRIHSLKIALLREAGVREVTLLGQNVNSYRDLSGETDNDAPTANT